MASLPASRLVSAAALLRAASQAFISFLDALPPGHATAPLPGGWTPAGHAYHVALTNAVFSGVLDGTGPLEAFDGDSDFAAADWSFRTPPAVAAPGILVPPCDVAAADAIRRIRETAAALASSIECLDASDARRAVRLPWGTVSIVQMCEWAGGHTLRHIDQVGRELQQQAAAGAAL